MHSFDQETYRGTERGGRDVWQDGHRDTGRVTIEPYGSNGLNAEAREVRQVRYTRQPECGPQGIGGWLIWWAIRVVVEVILAAGLVAKEPNALSIIVLGVCLWVAYLFFAKHRLFPTVCIVLMIVMTLIHMSNAASYSGLPCEPTPAYEIGRATATFLWIPYFLMSQRVKNTFVN